MGDIGKDIADYDKSRGGNGSDGSLYAHGQEYLKKNPHRIKELANATFDDYTGLKDWAIKQEGIKAGAARGRAREQQARSNRQTGPFYAPQLPQPVKAKKPAGGGFYTE